MYFCYHTVLIRRCADNNEVSAERARQLLHGTELDEFKWSVEEYIKYGRENAINGQWIKELENASAKHHVTRLEAMKLSVQQYAEKAFGNETDFVDKMARDVYRRGVYRTAYELEKGLEVGIDVSAIPEKDLDKIVAKPWAADGKNFSNRIWSRKEEMVNNLHKELTRTALTGDSPDAAIESLSRYVNSQIRNAKSAAGRLVQTEQAYFHSRATLDAFNELDVEEYEFVATLDGTTCDICGNMDGKRFRISDFEEGATAPPLHPRCRCVTVPYFNDAFTRDEKRAARDEKDDGKTHFIRNMNYNDWKKQYVDKPQFIKHDSYVIVGGTKYVVDDKHVLSDHTQEEILIAQSLAKYFNSTVHLVPRVEYPKYISTPDYIINGERYDLKSPTGLSKNLIYNSLHKKAEQAHKFVINTDKIPLSHEEIERQIEEVLHRQMHTNFVEEIIMVSHGKVIKVYKK